jgi:anti-sigma factor RsiW
MNCSEAETLIHALIDNELDAGHAREVEAHVATCPDCAAKLASFNTLRAAMNEVNLKENAPIYLRERIEAALPTPARTSTSATAARFDPKPPNRRFFVGGFASGALFTGAIAAALILGIFRGDENELIARDVVSAHLRSLQPGHLTDVETSDQHNVKPWFNGKLDVAPPVADLTAQGFTLIGGRLDDVNGETAAAVVYRRRNHVINLFIYRHASAAETKPIAETRHGFGIRYWTDGGLDFWAVSDINGTELDEFCRTFMAASHPPPPSRSS